MNMPDLAALWPRLEPLIDEALALTEAEQVHWLAALDAKDADLRETLELLLKSRGTLSKEQWLDTLPPVNVEWPGMKGGVPEPGQQVGAYTLIALIGRGGMGTVWQALRGDSKRTVALKLPHGSWGDALAERFGRERAILERLEHPNIARLYDAGTDELGRPWIAMEMVKGEAIDVHCKRLNLSLRERVKLLRQVVDAVAYAHTQLVVHRDLKPANILVSADGQVHLLDFGIAKLLGPSNELTQLEGRLLTLDYASPEQIRGDPISTASDIYSLGVIAFELLAGVRPYRLAHGSAIELERAIEAVDAPPASTVAVSRADAAQLRGDLDAILSQTLRKEPRRRYASADALSQDLARYLDDRPVIARPDTLAYRAGKFVSRYRLPVGIATMALAGVVASVVIALGQAREATLASKRAGDEAATAKAVETFIESVFRASSGDQADPVKARAATARDLIDRGADRIEVELQDAPVAKLRLLDVMAGMYEDMEVPDKALELHRKRLAFARGAFGPGSREYADALVGTANVLVENDERAEAKPMLDEARGVLDALHDDSSTTRARLETTTAENLRVSDHPAALAAAQRAVAILRRDEPTPLLVEALLMVGYNAANADQAVPAWKDAIGLVEARPELGSNMIGQMYNGLATTYVNDDKIDLAVQAYRRGVDAERTRKASAVEQAMTESAFAAFLYTYGRLAESLDYAEPTCRWSRTMDNPEYATHLARMHIICGRTLIAYGRLEDGLNELQRARDVAGTESEGNSSTAPLMMEWIVALSQQGRFDQAEQMLVRVKDVVARLQPQQHRMAWYAQWRLRLAQGQGTQALDDMHAYRASLKLPPEPTADESITWQVNAARIHLAAGDVEGAARFAQDTLDRIAKLPDARYEQPEQALALRVLGETTLQTQGAAAAVPILRKAVANERELIDPKMSLTLAEFLAVLARAERESGDQAAASISLVEARAIRARHPVVGPQYRF